MIGRDCTRSRDPFNEPDESTEGASLRVSSSSTTSSWARRQARSLSGSVRARKRISRTWGLRG